MRGNPPTHPPSKESSTSFVYPSHPPTFPLQKAGPYTTLAAEAINAEYGQFIPDFSASVPAGSEPVRCVQISRGVFRRFVHPQVAEDDFEAYLQRLREREEKVGIGG